MSIFQNKLIKRKMIAVSLGILFGLVCVTFANYGKPDSVWGTPLMWQIIYNRMLIGVFLTFLGVFNWHGVLGMRFSAWLRGLWAGAFVSLDLAMGTFSATDLPAEQISIIFWGTIGAGAFYGLLIDLIATKFAGEGKALLEGWTK